MITFNRKHSVSVFLNTSLYSFGVSPKFSVTFIKCFLTNPIILGISIDDKTFFLDIAITLNDDALINLEMQVLNKYNWPERSLSYLCRSFDQLNTGDYYQSTKPAIQIGLLDFTLFPEHPEFYATYKLMKPFYDSSDS